MFKFIGKNKIIKKANHLVKCIILVVAFALVIAPEARSSNQSHKITICEITHDGPCTRTIFERDLSKYLSLGAYKGKCNIKLDVRKVHDINFGSLLANSKGVVKLDPKTGNRTSTGGVFLMDGNYRFARYIVKGTPHARYNIHLPDDLMINTKDGDRLKIRKLKSFPAKEGKLNANGEQEVIVGGVLKVKNSADSGDYSGSFNIDVSAKH